MNKTEVAKLLTMASAIDNRTVGTETVEAWFIVIGEFDFEDASEAMFTHFRSSDEYLTPHKIVLGLEKIGKRREYEHRQLMAEYTLLVRDEGANPDDLLKSEKFQTLRIESKHE